jgi:hypothetical protein
MADKNLISADHEALRKVILHKDDGVSRVETRQDVTPILKAAEIRRDMTPGNELRHAAYIPKVVLDQAFNEGWFNDPKAWKRWANDPANAMFRTWPGNL